MIKLIRLETYKLRSNWWVVFVFVALIALSTVLKGNYTAKKIDVSSIDLETLNEMSGSSFETKEELASWYEGTYNQTAFSNILSEGRGVLWTGLLFSAYFFGLDFMGRTFQGAVYAGVCRYKLIASKLISYLVVVITMSLLSTCVACILYLPGIFTGLFPIAYIFRSIALGMLLDVGATTVMPLIYVLTRNLLNGFMATTLLTFVLSSSAIRETILGKLLAWYPSILAGNATNWQRFNNKFVLHSLLSSVLVSLVCITLTCVVYRRMELR